MDWGAELRRAHAVKTGRDRGIRLPRDVVVSGTADAVRVEVATGAMAANMQTDGAAFEAWVLALRAWCGVGAVTLDWSGEPDPADAHVQRFLYRAGRFARLFPWVRLARPAVLERATALTEPNLVLNTRRTGAKADAANPEAALERRLLHGLELEGFCGLTRLCAQVPVGLFQCEVGAGRRVFPGGAGAIDLLGTDGHGSLWLFELKAGGNTKLGILSELLLYTWMMQDVLRRRFRFANDQSGDPDGIQPGEITACRRIEARFIAPTFHPLLDGSGIVDLLNEAMTADDVPVRFAKICIDGGAGDEALCLLPG
ncbi:hypothetical protein [Oleisolibacter albus]|uniref:hypothetical protein n=1 Tax=Oleisolibacter albus TaxID=2171757 RepID=UPI000DF236DC|nr:hypothetical protein [Oleisolibacter albus]